VLAVCGAAAIVVALGYRIDLQLTFIALLLLAAVTLLLTPLLRRGRARGDGTSRT
jgi:membrane protein implicated in regulation of membrane protease activity